MSNRCVRCERRGGRGAISSLLVRLSVRVIVGLMMLLVIVPSSAAQSQTELKVKAAFVFNLTKYVEWPSAKSQLVIDVVGDGPVVDALKEALAGKTSDGRTIDVVVHPSDAELARCDMVYIASSSRKSIDQVLQKTSARNILTVGDSAEFAKNGGMVGLVTVGDRVEIQINLQASRKARLQISSRLLNLAKVVGPAVDKGQ